MTLSEQLRTLVVDRAPLDEIRRVASSEGMVPLHVAAWERARSGQTTVGEVARLVGEERLG
jgi:type II secretory ATPase GspE/PulE/Tfp pilus assembly ATPase PilB-like protein